MAAVAEPSLTLSFEEARHLVEEHAARLRPRGKELLDLLDSAGRILAESVAADRDFPPFPRATRDGYAVRAADLARLPATLEVIGEIKAVAASVGRSHLLVYGKPQAAVLTTGDEVVDIDVPPGCNQIRNSNSYSLAAQIQAAGGEPMLLPIAPDEPARLRELIADGFEADLLLLTGGVSMGKYDLVEQVLAEFQAEFFFTGAQIQPGRPIVFGRVPCSLAREREGHRFSRADQGASATAASASEEHKYFFGLPGNPVSTMVTFELFTRPILEALAGMPPRKLVFLHARLKSEIKTKTGLKRFLPAILSGEFEQAEVELARWQGSGDIAATARANCYVVVPAHRERIAPGEWVAVLLR